MTEVTGHSIQHEISPIGNEEITGHTIQLGVFCFEVVDTNNDPIDLAVVSIETDNSGLFSAPVVVSGGNSNINGISIHNISNGIVTVSRGGYTSTTQAFDFSLVPDGECITIVLEATSGMSTKLFSIPLVSTITQDNEREFCYCGLECQYIEKVFADDSSDWWKNDKNSFIFTSSLSGDTINVELWKNGKKLVDIIDNTLGEYYPTFTAQPLYVGFVIYWANVAQIYGYGSYQVKAQLNIIGQNSTFESNPYQLMVYDAEIADGTVRVEAYEKDKVLDSKFDFTNLLPNGWYTSYRIEGQLTKTPRLEVDNYLNNNRELRQVQDKIINEYRLETKLLPANTVVNELLSTVIQITDYNLFSSEILRRVSVYPTGIDEVKQFARNRNVKYIITFDEKAQRTVKNNLSDRS